MELVDSGVYHIVVDLADATFMDSTSLAALISARRRIYPHRGSFVIVCPDPRMRRMFEVTNLDKVFTIRSR
jgi:anti-sigma B factor antagonist